MPSTRMSTAPTACAGSTTKKLRPAHQQVPIGQAVVASACVPGLFKPIRLDGLYERRERGKAAAPLIVRQVDGGVHDNQGIAGLLEQDAASSW